MPMMGRPGGAPPRLTMRVALVTGIWPPDVGGPATHGPELARFLVARGHGVTAVTMGDSSPTDRPCPVRVVPRDRPFPVRYGRVAFEAGRAARDADVVYASATYAAAAAGALTARRPLVAKLVQDPAYERAQRYGLFRGSLEAFQHDTRPALRALRAARTAVVRAAHTVIVPSAYLGEIAASWGIPPERLEVVPNATPLAAIPDDVEVDPSTLVFVGRLSPAKAVHVLIDAVARLDGVRLIVIGDGPERARLESQARAAGLNGRIVFEGSKPREDVLRTLAGAQAAVLSSAYENLPHAAVEALAAGTPVVATAVGGVPEVVHDEENGLLVPPGSPEALADALRRLVHEPGLRDRLAAGARESAAAYEPEALYGRIETLLAEAVRR